MQKEELKFAGSEEPDLLVWRIPQEFILLDVAIQVFAIPLLGRSGGLLLAIPIGVLGDDMLLDAAIEEEGVLGPSRDFEAGLLEEDDDGAPQEVGLRCSFLVIDCSDAVCADLRRYDPVTDSTEEIRPFSSERPAALPATGDVLGDVREWIENVALARTAFYSAREEQEATPKAKATTVKRPSAPKRTSNAVLAEQVATLTEHMKLLAVQQEEILRSQQNMLRSSGSAEAAPVQALGGSSKRPGMPALTSTLPVPKAGQVAAVAKLVGPPPKVKSVPDAVARGPGDPADEPTNPLLPGDESPQAFAKALTQQSAAITALVAHLTTGDAMVDLSASSSS